MFQKRNKDVVKNIKYNNDCFICRPLEERIEHVTININHNLVVNIDDNNYPITATERKHIKYTMSTIMIHFYIFRSIIMNYIMQLLIVCLTINHFLIIIWNES